MQFADDATLCQFRTRTSIYCCIILGDFQISKTNQQNNFDFSLQ